MTERPTFESLDDPMGSDAYRDLKDEHGVVHFDDSEHANRAMDEWFRFSSFPGSKVKLMGGEAAGQIGVVLTCDYDTDDAQVRLDDGTEVTIGRDMLGFPHEMVIDNPDSFDAEPAREVDERTHAQQTPGSGEHWSDINPGTGPHPADIGW